MLFKKDSFKGLAYCEKEKDNNSFYTKWFKKNTFKSLLTRGSNGINYFRIPEDVLSLSMNLPPVPTSNERFPNVWNTRIENLTATKQPDFIINMINSIIYEVQKDMKQGLENTYINIGDMYSRIYFVKWVSIIDHIQNRIELLGIPKNNVRFLCVTSNLDAFRVPVEANFLVRHSINGFTSEDEINEGLEFGFATFEKVGKETLVDNNSSCLGDCSLCKKCYFAYNRVIRMEVK